MPAEALFADSSIPPPPREVLPGVIHMPGWLTVEQQNYLVRKFYEWDGAVRLPHANRTYQYHPADDRALKISRL